MEGAPAEFPVGIDFLRVGVLQVLRDLVDVRGELERRGELTFLETGRKALEPRGPRLLRALEGDADRDALQRNALFSFWKKPSSAA
jgi:hypothetical protein